MAENPHAGVIIYHISHIASEFHGLGVCARPPGLQMLRIERSRSIYFILAPFFHDRPTALTAFSATHEQSYSDVQVRLTIPCTTLRFAPARPLSALPSRALQPPYQQPMKKNLMIASFGSTRSVTKVHICPRHVGVVIFFFFNLVARMGTFTFLVCETIQHKLERCLLEKQDISSFMEVARGAADLWRINLYHHESAVYFPSYSTSHKRCINAGAIRKSKIPAVT